MYESGCARRVRPCGSSHARSTSSTRSPNRCGRRRHRMRRTGADPPAERLRSSCWSFAGSAGRVWRPLCGRRRDREPASGRRSGVRAGALAPRRGEPSRSASTWPPQGKSGSSALPFHCPPWAPPPVVRRPCRAASERRGRTGGHETGDAGAGLGALASTLLAASAAARCCSAGSATCSG